MKFQSGRLVLEHNQWVCTSEEIVSVVDCAGSERERWNPKRKIRIEVFLFFGMLQDSYFMYNLGVKVVICFDSAFSWLRANALPVLW